jgi:molybdate transport system ATP-binding protein
VKPEDAAVIDIDLHLSLSDGARRFVLAPAFASDARVVAIYGASGAGKSLTLQAMAGLIRPQRGHVRIGGRTLFDAARGIDVPTRARAVGYLFQHYALFPHLSVRDNIGFGLRSWWPGRVDAQRRRRVDELLALFEIEALAESRPAALSGGQQQRVALARALACEPRVLLLDEPFAALNPMLRAGLRSELAALRARLEIPIVMITHDIDDLAALAEHVFVLDDGRIVRDIDLRAHARPEHGLLPLRPAPMSPEQRERLALLGDALAHI